MLGTQDTEASVDIYSVSDLNLAVRSVLDEAFDTLWIKGEISNFSSPRSGHWYFTLKDDKAQVKCAMFRGANWKVGFQPENGMEVSLFAKVSLYPERGDYQLIGERMEISGEGQLQKAFELLKKKLQQEGLFKQSHKKPFPPYPSKIAVITSATGAAVKDILSVLERRYPVLEVEIIPTMVQGQGASATIVRAIELANQRSDYDLIILARGGGSLEDLWCFNEENVAYAIYNSQLPIISGIGHETDFTIADYVADLRAPTPSVAAETVTPDGQELAQLFEQYQDDLSKLMLRQIADLSQTVDYLDKRLVSPQKALRQHSQNLIHLSKRQARAMQVLLSKEKHRLVQSCMALKPNAVNQQIQGEAQHLSSIHKTMANLIEHKYKDQQKSLHQAMRTLHAVSPLATVDRGYTITKRDNQVISSAKTLKPGDMLETQFKDGKICSKVQH